MSDFSTAAEALKRNIEAIGEKSFSVNDDWLKTPSAYPNYSKNLLQALWNIADTLYVGATKKNTLAAQWYLFGKRHDLTRWFHYLEPITGTPRIDDAQSYQLGQALLHFLKITISSKHAKSLLSSAIASFIGIEDPMVKLTDSIEILTKRLADYEAMHRITIPTDLVELAPRAPATPPPIVTPAPITHLHMIFFGSEPSEHIGGIFGDYLKERETTFWFRDLCSQFAALLLGYYGYQTEAMARREYLHQLKNHVLTYQTAPETYSDLHDHIHKGLQTFSPRSNQGPDYHKSLHAKLTHFKSVIVVEEVPVIENQAQP